MSSNAAMAGNVIAEGFDMVAKTKNKNANQYGFLKNHSPSPPVFKYRVHNSNATSSKKNDITSLRDAIHATDSTRRG